MGGVPGFFVDDGEDSVDEVWSGEPEAVQGGDNDIRMEASAGGGAQCRISDVEGEPGGAGMLEIVEGEQAGETGDARATF